MDSFREERRRAIYRSEKKEKISQNRGHKTEKYSVRRARLHTESLHRNNQGNTLAAERGAREQNPFTRTGWYTPFSPKSKVSGAALQGQTTYSSRVADIFASRDLLNGESVDDASLLPPPIAPQIEMRFNTMKIYRDAT